MLLDVKEGRRIWTRQELGESVLPGTVFADRVRGFEGPLFDSDTTVILYTDGRTLRKYDLTTGAVLWETRDPPSPGEPPAIARQAGGLLKSLKGLARGADSGEDTEERQVFDVLCAPMLVARSGDRFYAPYLNTVFPLSRETGLPLWKGPPRLSGTVVEMQELPAGLLVRTLSYDQGSPSLAVELLQRDTGMRLWRVPGKGSGLLSRASGSWSSTSNLLVDGDRILIASEGKLMTIDIPTGRDRVLGKLDFENDDDPVLLYRAAEGFCVAGTQNLGIYSSEDGRRIRKFYREPPSGSTGVGVALLAASALSYGTGVLEGALTPVTGFNELARDYTSTQERDDYIYFLSDLRDGDKTEPGLIRVNKRTGNPEGEIALGTKKPVYMVDPDGRIIFTPNSKTLMCLRF
jgi:outer membrane protein assembly factor BamB